MENLKIVPIFMLALIIISIFGTLVSAEDTLDVQIDETEDSDEIILTDNSDSIDETTMNEMDDVDPGITPDSPLYGLDNALDRIRLKLTLNREKRAEKALKIAEERLAEVKAMIEANKAEKAERARERHDEFIESAEVAMDEIETNGDPTKAELALQKIARLQIKVEKHYEKVSSVKSRILERQRERMTEEQITHLEEVFSKLEGKTERARNRVAQKQENTVTKYKALSEKTDEEIEEMISTYREEIQAQKQIKQANKIAARERNGQDSDDETSEEEPEIESEEDDDALEETENSSESNGNENTIQA